VVHLRCPTGEACEKIPAKAVLCGHQRAPMDRLNLQKVEFDASEERCSSHTGERGSDSMGQRHRPNPLHQRRSPTGPWSEPLQGLARTASGMPTIQLLE
jgi:hypothetical protein